MLSEEEKKQFARLELDYSPIAIKFSYCQPEGVERTDEVLSFCQYMKKAQTENRKFYITKEDDDCCGKIALGMVPKDPFTVSGIAGVDFEVFRTEAANIRLHNTYPVINPGTVRFVEFCPVALCDFDPDLVVCVANVSKADIIMRATSYISGDLWECRTSCVMSCAWTYAYPYLTGKVNFCTTGMHHGMKRRGVYPEGLHIISIPYQKLDEVVKALGEMPWTLIALRQDEESKAELKRRMDHWKELSEFTFKECQAPTPNNETATEKKAV
jgi:uncharacterized protein (DUF169 family)